MKKQLSFLFLALCACVTLQAQSFSFTYNGHTYNHLDTMVYQVKAVNNYVVSGITVHNNTSNDMSVIASCVNTEPCNMSVIGASNGSLSSANYYTHSFNIPAGADHQGVEFTLDASNAVVGETDLFYILVSDAGIGTPDSSAGSYVFVKFVATPNVGYVHFREDFESMTQRSGYICNLPASWSTIADTRTNYQDYTTWGKSWVGLQYTQDNKVAGSVSYLNNGTADRWLITPKIDIPYQDLYLTFSVWGYSSSYPESLKVYVSTTGKEKADFTATAPVLNLPTVNVDWTQYIIDLNDYVGDSIYIAFQNCGDNGYYILIDDVTIGIPAHDEISITSINLPGIAPSGTPINIKGSVTNYGIANLNSYEVYYIANGDTSATFIVNNINVPFGQSHSFTHNVPYTPAIGANNITVVVAKPNDVVDYEDDNSLSGSFDAYDPAGTTPRKVLMENFTTAQCPNCPSAHTRIHNAIAGLNDVIWVAHHVGYGTDAMTLNLSNQLTRFYNDDGTYAPALMLDRTNFDIPSYDNAPGPIFFPGSDVADAINYAREQPAFVSVYFPEITYNESTRQLDVTIAGQFVSDMTMSSPRISCYIIEDSIMSSQQGVSGLFKHDHVIRASLSNILGDANVITSTTAGSTFTKSYSTTFPASWKANYCRVVAFVSEYTSNVNNCKVANSNISDFIHNGTVGIGEVEENISIRLFPNPASDKLFVETDCDVQEVSLINALGQVVYSNNHITGNQIVIDLDNYASGLYIVNVRNSNGTTSRRVNVIK